MNLKKIIFAGIALVLLVTAMGLLIFPPQGLYNQLQGKAAISGFQSSLVLSNYQMRNQDSQLMQWQDFNDKPLYITTGFTSCTYTCPVTVAFLQKLADNPEVDAAFSFLTVDPVNDTPNVLKQYLQAFAPDLIGLNIADKGLFNKALSDLRQSVSELPGTYDIVHSDLIYLHHPKLDGLVIYSTFNLDKMVSDLKKLAQI